jgi:hypothetical protein
MNHAADAVTQGAFVFASLGGTTCSICAPLDFTQTDVEDFAELKLGNVVGGWHAVDTPSPGPCNVDAANRRHWFLLDGINAAQLGFRTRK